MGLSQIATNRQSLVIGVQEQLGFKLEAGKIALEVLVMNHVDKVPAGN
jgi:uncharacterized protein (TIGR03435 family)